MFLSYVVIIKLRNINEVNSLITQSLCARTNMFDGWHFVQEDTLEGETDSPWIRSRQEWVRRHGGVTRGPGAVLAKPQECQ